VTIEQYIAVFFESILGIVYLFASDPMNLFLFSLLLLNTLGYILVLAIIVKVRHNTKGKNQAQKTSESTLPLISFIIPAYNEEETIERKLENTFDLNYPPNALEVIVVDDGSTDKTSLILENLQQTRFPTLKIIRQNRKGKSAAENAGLQKSKGDVVVISDADVPLNQDALQFMVKDFEDPKVGGVTCAIKADEKYVLALNLDLASYTRNLENKIDSIFGMSGPFVAFRKSVVSTIDEGIFSSDTDLGIIIRRKGLKVVFDSRITSDVDQWVVGRPKTVIGALRKMKHLSYGSLVLFLRHKDILFRKRYGIFGLIIAPRNLLLNVFAPIIFIIFSANFIFRLVESNLFLSFTLLSSLFLLMTFLLRKIAPGFVATKALYLLFMYILGYFAQFIYYIMFLSSSRQRHGTWSGFK
jgi:biofilm PGA synthesis N-glycosyltransferase PgaC